MDEYGLEMEDCICIAGCRRISKQLAKQGIKFNRYCNPKCNSYTPSLRSEWGKAVKERDGNKCVICGSETYLEAHHIIPWYCGIKYRYNINNGITLCRDCHRMAHDTESAHKYEEYHQN